MGHSFVDFCIYNQPIIILKEVQILSKRWNLFMHRHLHTQYFLASHKTDSHWVSYHFIASNWVIVSPGTITAKTLARQIRCQSLCHFYVCGTETDRAVSRTVKDEEIHIYTERIKLWIIRQALQVDRRQMHLISQWWTLRVPLLGPGF